jgi:hypothetical protein
VPPTVLSHSSSSMEATPAPLKSWSSRLVRTRPVSGSSAWRRSCTRPLLRAQMRPSGPGRQRVQLLTEAPRPQNAARVRIYPRKPVPVDVSGARRVIWAGSRRGRCGPRAPAASRPGSSRTGSCCGRGPCRARARGPRRSRDWRDPEREGSRPPARGRDPVGLQAHGGGARACGAFEHDRDPSVAPALGQRGVQRDPATGAGDRHSIGLPPALGRVNDARASSGLGGVSSVSACSAPRSAWSSSRAGAVISSTSVAGAQEDEAGCGLLRAARHVEAQ